ncbi:hypothetical protein K493DRAFT_317594 [Basidiobolus meristosporus CBS 931.73]|uniref:RGS domain-containing protein n=1 Tax=Basidiobolus meristosporus CBS 931.73 TaxID=1314790 RepID=A0A1Y1XZ13_9FUNG|nr:hypothetical protein K493DRAFT_317594 [Basidiobolus meristosporus CBS 931.73]|eukprot:ORX90981.1 hypothetical protein K493DRAFT_317594 [Basidiobolus meristosporus CBS 931.73]
MYKLPNSSKESTKSQTQGRSSLDSSQRNVPSQSRRPLSCAQLSSSPDSQLSTPFEIERQLRRSKLQDIRHRRTSNHIYSFIRINALVDDLRFPVTSARTSTIEDLARQIEAEYAFNYSCSPAAPLGSGGDSEEEYAKMDLLGQFAEYEELEPSESQPAPLICGSLFVDQIELRFSDVVGEVLNMNDTVRVVNVYEAPVQSISPVNRRSSSFSDKKRWSFPSIRRSLRVHSRVHSATESEMSYGYGSSMGKKDWKDSFTEVLEERFQGILFNNTLLGYFQQFCLQQYAIESLLFWIEVELFRNTMLALVPNAAQYIYQTYIAKDSPLQVNLCDEIRNEIPETFGSEDDYLPNITIFDEAQEYIYEMLMHHTFQCFEESSCYEQMLDQCQEELNRRAKSIVHQPLDGLAMNIELMDSVLADIRTHPDKIHEGWFKEDVLERVIKNYFPDCPLNGHNYFCDGRRLTLAQKRRKMQLEKKLSKFFGQRLTEEELTQQQLFEVMNSRRNSVTSISSLPSYISSKAPGKKKKLGKLEKLEGFFGKRLSNTQLEYQNLISRKEMHLPADCTNCQSIPPESALPISTYNDLSSEERRVLTKRSRKLKCLLGEPIDEQTAFKSLTYPVINHRSSVDLDACSLTDTVVSDPLPSPAPLYRRTSKEVKRKKLVKLYQLLGTYPSVDDVKIKSLERKESLLDRNGKPLAPEIKRLHLKKANKLERVFGQHPPKDLIVDKSNDATPEKRTSVLSLLVENDASVEDLVEYIQALTLLNDSDSPSTEDEELPSSHQYSNSIPNLPTYLEESDREQKILEELSGSKATRQRKLAKLRRFFGNDLGLESLIAQNILLRHQLATEGLYSLHESLEDLGHHSLEDFDLINNETFVRTAMKNDLEILRREVEELHRQAKSSSAIDAV